MKGTLNILPMSIYVNNKSTEEILSLKEVASLFCMNMDTKQDHTTLVHFNKYKTHCFKEFGNGLYHFGISDQEIFPLTAKDTVID